MNTGNYRFYLPVQVRYADTDAQGHVFFGNYFTYFDEAVGGYFRAIGVPWQKLLDLGLDIFYVSAHCDFKGAARSEETLHVYARMDRIGRSSLTVSCTILKEEHDEQIANGYITAVIVDPETRTPVRVPDEIRQAVAAYEGTAPAGDTGEAD